MNTEDFPLFAYEEVNQNTHLVADRDVRVFLKNPCSDQHREHVREVGEAACGKAMVESYSTPDGIILMIRGGEAVDDIVTSVLEVLMLGLHHLVRRVVVDDISTTYPLYNWEGPRGEVLSVLSRRMVEDMLVSVPIRLVNRSPLHHVPALGIFDSSVGFIVVDGEVRRPRREEQFVITLAPGEEKTVDYIVSVGGARERS